MLLGFKDEYDPERRDQLQKAIFEAMISYYPLTRSQYDRYRGVANGMAASLMELDELEYPVVADCFWANMIHVDDDITRAASAANEVIKRMDYS